MFETKNETDCNDEIPYIARMGLASLRGLGNPHPSDQNAYRSESRILPDDWQPFVARLEELLMLMQAGNSLPAWSFMSPFSPLSAPSCRRRSKALCEASQSKSEP